MDSLTEQKTLLTEQKTLLTEQETLLTEQEALLTHITEQEELSKKITEFETVFKAALDEKNFDTLSQLISPDIPLDIVTQMLDRYEPETNEFKYLIAIKIMWVHKSFTNEYINKLKKSIGCICQASYCIHLDVKSQNENIEYTEEYMNSPKFMQYCDKLYELFWSVRMDDLEHYVLTLINCFLDPNNLFESQPHLKIKDDIKVFELVCGITEIISVYFVILKDLFEYYKIDKNIIFPESVVWCLDNNDNPLEKNIKKFIEKNPSSILESSDSGDCLRITAKQYHDFVRETYDIPIIISGIEKIYLRNTLDTIKILDKSGQYGMDLDKLIPIALCDFVMGHNLCQFIN